MQSLFAQLTPGQNAVRCAKGILRAVKTHSLVMLVDRPPHLSKLPQNLHSFARILVAGLLHSINHFHLPLSSGLHSFSILRDEDLIRSRVHSRIVQADVHSRARSFSRAVRERLLDSNAILLRLVR